MTSRWRPKNRRQILQLDDDESLSPSVQNNIATNNPTATVTAPANKLHALLGHYNSDEDESGKEEEDSEFKDFMKEIKSTEETPVPSIPSVWQELWDPQSGQPYYWHTVTNELTWDKPQDLGKVLSTKTSTGSNKAINKPSMAIEEGKTLPTSSVKREPSVSVSKTVPTPVITEGSIDPPKGELVKKDEGKVSFKIATLSERMVNKVGPELNQAKTNGRLIIDVDSIIASIEKEIPPDYKTETFVPLFRRRLVTSQDSRPKLGNDFKNFFRPTHPPVFDLEPVPSVSPTTVVNTFRGLGYQEKEETAVSEPVQKIAFIAGEILKPMVPVAPVVPLTMAQKITRLENHLNSQEELPGGLSKIPLAAQLDILKEAWSSKKLEADFLDEWLETIEKKMKEETANPTSEEHRDQVIDMVLEDSGSESPGISPTPEVSASSSSAVKNDEVAVCLDSALSSFYTDLASLDTVATDPPVVTAEAPTVPVPETTPQVAVASVAETVPSSTVEEETSCEPIKGIKRTKMSSDMTSLVAKWQKIHQANT